MNAAAIGRVRAEKLRAEFAAKVQAGRTMHSPVRSLSREEIAAIYGKAPASAPGPAPASALVRVVDVEPVLAGPRRQPTDNLDEGAGSPPLASPPFPPGDERQEPGSIPGPSTSAPSTDTPNTMPPEEPAQESRVIESTLSTARALREELAALDKQREEKLAALREHRDALRAELADIDAILGEPTLLTEIVSDVFGTVLSAPAAPPKPAAKRGPKSDGAPTLQERILAVVGREPMELKSICLKLPDANAGSVAAETRNLAAAGQLVKHARGLYSRRR